MVIRNLLFMPRLDKVMPSVTRLWGDCGELKIRSLRVYQHGICLAKNERRPVGCVGYEHPVSYYPEWLMGQRCLEFGQVTMAGFRMI